jgi:hypothetical protein
MADISYTRGNIAKAIDYLISESVPHPRRAWEAYQIIIRGDVRDGMENEFAELDSIFRGVRHDQIGEKVSESEAKRGAGIMQELSDTNSERRGRESILEEMGTSVEAGILLAN